MSYRQANCGDDEPVEDLHSYKGQDGNDYWADGPAKGTRPGSVAESWSKEKSAGYDADREYYAKLAGDYRVEHPGYEDGYEFAREDDDPWVEVAPGWRQDLSAEAEVYHHTSGGYVAPLSSGEGWKAQHSNDRDDYSIAPSRETAMKMVTGGLLEDLREIGDAGIEGDLGAMAERNDRVRDAVDAANEAGYDASQFVASAIRRYYAKGRHRVDGFAGSGAPVTNPYTGDEGGSFKGNPQGRGHWVDEPAGRPKPGYESPYPGVDWSPANSDPRHPDDRWERDDPRGRDHMPNYQREGARDPWAPEDTPERDRWEGDVDGPEPNWVGEPTRRYVPRGEMYPNEGRAVELPDASDEDLVLEMLRNRAPHGQVGDGDKGWDDEVVGEFGRRASWFGQLAAAPEPAEAAAGDHLPFNGSGNAPSLEFGSTDAWVDEHESAGLVDVTDLGEAPLIKAAGNVCPKCQSWVDPCGTDDTHDDSCDWRKPGWGDDRDGHREAKIVDVTDGDGVIKYSDDKAPQIERFAEFLPPGWGGNPSNPDKDDEFPLPPGLGPVVDAVKALPLPIGELGEAVQSGQAASAAVAGTGPRAAKRIGGGSAPAQNFSVDDIAANAQAFLRTAGRVYSAGEQRTLEEESHPLGARNLDGLELDGTHYLS
jgi:hypothetical protein